VGRHSGGIATMRAPWLRGYGWTLGEAVRPYREPSGWPRRTPRGAERSGARQPARSVLDTASRRTWAEDRKDRHQASDSD
jgi:hypothetical protein